MTVIDYFKHIGIDVKEIVNMREEPLVNLNVITVQDCIDMKNFKDRETIINDGKIVDIVYPEYTEK